MISPKLFSLLKYLLNPKSVLWTFSSFKRMSYTRRPHGERPRRLYGNHKRIRVVPVVSKISETTGATRTTIWKPGLRPHEIKNRLPSLPTLEFHGHVNRFCFGIFLHFCSEYQYSKNPHKRTGVLGVQADFVTHTLGVFCKISLKVFSRCS